MGAFNVSESEENMHNINAIKTNVMIVVGASGSAIASLFGGWGDDMTTLLIFMGIDFFLGLMIAAFWKKSNKSVSGALNSQSAWKGLARKGGALLVVLVAHRLDMMLGLDYIRTAAVIAFILNELISIVENLGIMGVPLPPAVKKAIEVLQNREEKEGGSNG